MTSDKILTVLLLYISDVIIVTVNFCYLQGLKISNSFKHKQLIALYIIKFWPGDKICIFEHLHKANNNETALYKLHSHLGPQTPTVTYQNKVFT